MVNKEENMIPNMNLSEARTESINPGGYVMRILGVEIDNKYNSLKLKCDIAEGDKEGYYQRLEERGGFWGMYVWLDMDEKRKWKFAKAIDALCESNDDFIWNYDGENDEQTMVGKLIGVVTRLRYYYGNDGQMKSKIVPYSTTTADNIRTKNFTVPEPDKSKIQAAEASFSGEVVDTTAGFEDIKTDDLTF